MVDQLSFHHNRASTTLAKERRMIDWCVRNGVVFHLSSPMEGYTYVQGKPWSHNKVVMALAPRPRMQADFACLTLVGGMVVCRGVPHTMSIEDFEALGIVEPHRSCLRTMEKPVMSLGLFSPPERWTQT
jgi:hypothetical protein